MPSLPTPDVRADLPRIRVAIQGMLDFLRLPKERGVLIKKKRATATLTPLIPIDTGNNGRCSVSRRFCYAICFFEEAPHEVYLFELWLKRLSGQ
jgi:hypothetical protein